MKKRQIASFEAVDFEAVSAGESVNCLLVRYSGIDAPGRVISSTEVIELRDWLNEITGHPTPRLITHEDVHTLLNPLKEPLVFPVMQSDAIRIGHDDGYNGGGQRTVIEDGKKVTEPVPALDQRGLSAGLILDAKEIAERRAILAQEALKPHIPDALTVSHLPSIEKRLKAEGMEFMDMSDREAKGK